MAEELGWRIEDFDKAFAEVFRQGMAKADFRAKIIWLPNAIKYNRPESPNVVRSWRGELDLLPECDLKDEACIAIRAKLEILGDAYITAFREICNRPSRKASAKAIPNQEQEQEKEQEKEYSASGDAVRTFDLPQSGSGKDPDPPTEELPVQQNQEASEEQSRSGPKQREPGSKPVFLTRKKRKLAGWKLEGFEQFWLAFDWKKGRAEAADAWLEIPDLSDDLVTIIVKAAGAEARERPILLEKGQTPKWPQGWLSGRRWEDYGNGNGGDVISSGQIVTAEEMRDVEEHFSRIRKRRNLQQVSDRQD